MDFMSLLCNYVSFYELNYNIVIYHCYSIISMNFISFVIKVEA